MDKVVDDFRCIVGRWFEVPYAGIPKGGTPVGLAVGLHRYFGQFEAHRYPIGESLRVNGAPNVPLIGVAVHLSEHSGLLVYSRYDDAEQLYRQVRVRHDPIISTEVSRVLVGEEAEAAMRIAANPLLHHEDIERLGVLSDEERGIIEEGAVSVAALHASINAGLAEIDEAERAGLAYMNNAVL